MSHIVTESDAYPTNVVVPDPGELVKAADVENAVQPLANRTKNHETHGFFDTDKRASGNGGDFKLSASGRIQLAAGSSIQSLQSAAAHSTNLDGWFERGGMMYRNGEDAREKFRNNMQLDANADITTQLDTWFLPSPTVDRTYTVRLSFPTDLQIGERIRIVRVKPGGSFAHASIIVSESGQTLFIFGGGGYQGFVLLEYGPKIGGGNDWLPIGWQHLIPGAGSGVWGL